MELHFRGPRSGEQPNRESGYCNTIPKCLREFAASLGVTLPRGRVISHEQGEALYQQMVGLKPELAEQLRVVEAD